MADETTPGGAPAAPAASTAPAPSTAPESAPASSSPPSPSSSNPPNGSQTAGEQGGTAEGEDVEDEFRGWWASQLPKEARAKYRDRILPLKDKRLGDVFEDFFGKEDRLKGAVFLPGKDAKPAEIEGFLKQMGIPRKADEYALEKEKLPDGWGDKEAVAKSIGNLFLKNGLTARQGKAVFAAFMEAEKASAQAEAARLTKLKETVDARLEASLGDKKKAGETKEYFRRAIAALGDREFVRETAKTGVLYSPVFIKAVADLWKAGNVDPPVGGGEGSRRGKGGGSGEGGSFAYSDDFKKAYGGR